MPSGAITAQEASERARRLYAEHPVLDSLPPTFTCKMHLTPAMVELARGLQAEGKTRSAVRLALAEHLIEAVPRDPAARQGYLDFWTRAGITAASCTIYDSGPPSRAWEETLVELARSNRLVKGLEDALTVAGGGADVERAHREGRHAVIYDLALRWSAGMVREETSAFDWLGWQPEHRFDPNLQTKDLETWDRWPNLTAAMLRRGIPEADVVKIVGGNFLRIFREVCG